MKTIKENKKYGKVIIIKTTQEVWEENIKRQMLVNMVLKISKGERNEKGN